MSCGPGDVCEQPVDISSAHAGVGVEAGVGGDAAGALVAVTEWARGGLLRRLNALLFRFRGYARLLRRGPGAVGEHCRVAPTHCVALMSVCGVQQHLIDSGLAPDDLVSGDTAAGAGAGAGAASPPAKLALTVDFTGGRLWTTSVAGGARDRKGGCRRAAVCLRGDDLTNMLLCVCM